MKKHSRSRKSFTLMVCLMLVSLGLAGCGGTSTSGSLKQGASGGGTANAKKEIIKMRIGSGHTPEGTTWVRMVKNYFIPEVNKALEHTNYQIEWNEAYGGTIAKLGEELESVESGLLDMAYVSSPFEPAKLKISNIGYNVPFSTSDPTVIAKVSQKLLDTYPEFSGEYAKANQKLLGLGFSESYHLVTNFPVTKLDDLKGHKMGAAGPNLPWIKSLGAVPVQAGLTEVYQGLQSGLIDGYVTFSFSALGYKFYEQAKYFTKVGLGSVILGGVTINNNKWKSLPKEVQDVLEKTGKGYTVAMGEELKRETDDNLKKMQEHGAIVSELADSEKEKWVNALPDMPNDYAKKLNDDGLPGTRMMRDYIQGQIDAGYTFPKAYNVN